MKQLLTLLSIAFFTLQALAQSPSKMLIKGTIRDKETNIGMPDASIICLYAKDSSRVALGFTNKNGHFIFDSLPRQDYILYITYMGYHSLMYNVSTILKNSSIDVGIIEMKRAGFTLSEIEIIETKPPIRIAKDTIEFNASHFKTKNNALVEDLLKKIPGIQFAPDGTIRINGEAVKSIMVNGRLLFSNGDPKTISRNLQADLIDKVQLINKIETNGVNNGQPDKIINITIKKNKQNLLSGELVAAIGTSDRFAMKTNLSRFREHQQILLMAAGDNVNGLTDIKSLSGGGSIKAWNIGGSYIEDISKKLTISINYTMNNKLSLDEQNRLKQSFTSDSNLFYRQDSRTINDAITHLISTQLEYKIDSLQKIIFSNQVALSNTTDIFSNTYESTVSNIRNINNGTVNNSSKSNLNALSSGLTYEKRFLKNGRFLSIWLVYSKSDNKESTFNASRNSYFITNGDKIGDTINQHFNTITKNQQVLLVVNYTEPIIKGGFITFTLGEDRTSGLSEKSAYNYNTANGLYDKYNDTMSNKFKNTPTLHYAKMSWLFQKDNFDYTISLSSLFYDLNYENLSLGNNLPMYNISMLPEINFHYSLGINKYFRLYYKRQVEFPQMSQLQPVPDISDPLSIKRGNPELKPTSSNIINLSYNTFNTITMRSLSISINGKLLHNQITNDSKIDSVGRQEIKPFNHSGAYVINFDLTGGFPLKKQTNSITINTQSSLEKSLNYVNGIENTNNSLSITQTISYNSERQKLIDYTVSSNISYNKVHSSNISSTTTSNLNLGISSSGNLNLPSGIVIGTFVSYRHASGLMADYNNNIWILNASISKILFVHKQGLITVQGFDLLKQNKSITRNFQPDYIEDVRTNTLDPFFLVRFSYFLGKGKK